MAALLHRWVNEEIGLSRDVQSFEADFASGFLLGELLHRFNQQKGFSSFQDSNTSDAKVANFILLEPTLRAMGIRFDAVIAQGEPATNFVEMPHKCEMKQICVHIAREFWTKVYLLR